MPSKSRGAPQPLTIPKIREQLSADGLLRTLRLDPPYKLRKCRLYLGQFDHARLFEWLGQQKGGYAMSLNGFIGDEDRRINVPEHLYHEELLIDNGVSALRQMNGMTTPRLRDSLYLRLR